ncbi:MAG: protein kinase [Brasilonema octagenarum HA4186-MV1]|jgi:serine/threonine-protein kinase|uniref:non-specific serine/threonine protein kinase n=2 Tax=Brasilonema TaxID=383614 RepID=A0A856MJ78_9CYAN|nr:MULTISPECIES: FHA domain-containing serine/threonine-protein kinase [Brasilonema]MBW4624995.1 protein kinase [Brasilonema octagenarum HA4186-MV1]NMF66467.1 serine/threonine protein kinase [Brasilonema octagenarum UFV-OR1]QDL10339.1 serine/threonine protein kinase [Brasilonema sennae CENA114]QDL16686.1 serine/threonine protein kinase [Brasilonema octagenarum UFV-E1]
MIGQLLAGRYKVLEVLGEGGFGQTYIAEDVHLPGNPKCVLKHLKTSSTDPDILETVRRLFQKEAETLQQLGNHDQIPRLLAYFEEKQEFYLAQEFISGHPVSMEFPPGRIWTEPHILEMLNSVLGILEFVHSHGVIHRDIKPDNIIRRASDNKLVLIDFGAIKQLQSQTAVGTRQNHITLITGTRGYMPSEQIRRLPRPSSDIYALGMMGIQGLTGVHPHQLQDDPNTGEILWQHLATVSPGLAAILTKMTRYHFKDRYQTATEVLLALRESATNSDKLPTEEACFTTNILHELSLEWEENGQVKNRKILEKQQSKNPSRGVRIGRDPQVCDIVISDPTVSALHIEIFFHQQKQKFYLRNLRQMNPPIVDGQLLLAGEMPLCVGSNIRLGQQNFQVSDIVCNEYPGGYVPIEYSIVPIALQQPINQTMRIPKVKKAEENSQEVLLTPESVLSSSAIKVPKLLGMSVAACISAVGGFSFLNSNNMIGTHAQQNFISQQPQLCRVVSPPGGRFVAKLRPEPQTEVGAVKQLNLGVMVLFVQVRGDFVEVKLPDGTQGWLFRDEVQPCTASQITH